MCKQIQPTATSYLEAIHRYPGPFDVFSEADSADIDHAVDVARQGMLSKIELPYLGAL
jgi:hypothetical protein